MPDRIARSSVTIPKAKEAKKRSGIRLGKKSLNAYSIASEQDPDTLKIRRHRLGEAEDEGPEKREKRLRDDDDESEHEHGVSNAKGRHQKRAKKGRLDGLDISEGSDSEGNNWTYGRVGEAEDSDIDSDEAFDEDDEDRFAGFTFRGSSSVTPKKADSKRKRTFLPGDNGGKSEESIGIDLSEKTNAGDSQDEGSLGDDAIDLATALDQYSGSEDEGEEFETDGEDVEAERSDFSVSDVEDDDDADKLARLEDLVTAMHPDEPAASTKRRVDLHETRMPSATGITSEKFDVNDLFATSDPSLHRAAKEFTVIPKRSKKRDPKLGPQLPKRHQDKLDRRAASVKAKETLGRWDDTVKQNRIAEHLSFPLVNKDQLHPQGQKQLMPTTGTAPLTNLESAIQNILHESGLGKENGNSEQKRIEEFEELQTNKTPVEDVMARRAELRKQRDLLFREELRATRIKKIKSKTYRRVHRKERERLADRDRVAFADHPDQMNEEEWEAHNRRRAEERMASKHRNSKWAKQMKKSGRSVWDQEARSGVTEMARRNEELRLRIEGKDTQNVESGNDVDDESEEDEVNEEGLDVSGDAAELKSIEHQLERETGVSADDGAWSRLARMQFMKRAETKRKEENDEAIRQMRKELAGEKIGSSDSVEESIGRKVFGPAPQKSRKIEAEVERNPFEAPEEREEYDEEEFAGFDEEPNGAPKPAVDVGEQTLANDSRFENDFILDPGAASIAVTAANAANTANGVNSSIALTGTNSAVGQSGPVSKPLIQKGKETRKPALEREAELLPSEKHSHPDADGWVTVTYDRDEEEESDKESEVDQLEIIRRAFAADDVEVEFEKEKAEAAAEENEKVIDNTLPGWGSWVGDGLTKREKQAQRKNRGRFITKQEGIKPEHRKDKKLMNVIINQRRIKNNVGYLANTLPFPFQDKREYERSIRMPVGNEWNTTSVYQRNIKPRVIVKPGAIIKPMDKPMAP